MRQATMYQQKNKNFILACNEPGFFSKLPKSRCSAKPKKISLSKGAGRKNIEKNQRIQYQESFLILVNPSPS